MPKTIPALGATVVGATVAIVLAACGTSKTVTTTVTQTAAASGQEPTALKSTTGMSIHDIYQAASPGVVDILVQSKSGSGGLLGSGGTQEGEGAGVVYNTKGDILTDEHVVANATAVKVNFANGKSVSAKVVGSDPSSDVGVIHVDVPASELHPIPVGDSASAQVGDPVVAIGSPFGQALTTTQGIVSQTGRSIKAPNGYTIPGAIQTDAAINPGNSGGPLLDATAHWIGLNDQIETNNQTVGGEGSSSGVGFATPAAADVKVANQIIAGQAVKHAYLGVSLNGATGGGGAEVAQVRAGSPGAQAGLQVNDVITAVDGKAVGSTDQFIATLNNYQPGQVVTLTITRQGQTKQVKVTLGNRPAQTPSNQ